MSEVAKLKLKEVPDVRSMLVNDAARKALAGVAATMIDPNRMMKLVSNALRTTPKLGECEPLSLLGSLMTSASIGLEPNTVLGHSYLVPFYNGRKKITEVQLIIGYKGFIDLARRSGHITSIMADIHYSDDDLWEYEQGTEARLRHRPGQLEGEKLHAYAIAQFKDGGHAYVVLPWSRIRKIRDASQGYQQAEKAFKEGKKWLYEKSPWVSHEDEMAKKTAIRALAKYLPLSIEFGHALAADDGKLDSSAFALNPDAGLDGVIDGEVMGGPIPDNSHAETETREDQSAEITGQRPATDTKPAERKEEPRKQNPATKPVTDQGEGTSASQKRDTVGPHEEMVEEITLALDDADTAQKVDAIMGMYAEEIDSLPPELNEKILDAKKDRMKAVG